MLPVIFLCLAMNLTLPAQTAPQIAAYYGNKKAALSLTFDDGFSAEVEDTVAILDPLEIKGTFFLIPAYMDGSPESVKFVIWDRVLELQNNGHEIGTHGSIREKLHEATDERLDTLINGSWSLIRERTGVAPVSYAAPGGSEVDQRVEKIIRQNHQSIRKAELLPDAVVAGYGSAGERVWEDKKTREQIEEAIQHGQWFIPIVHSIVGGYSPFQSKDEFRHHCEWIKSRDADLWIAPMGVVGSYVADRDAAKLATRSSSHNKVVFAVQHPHSKPFRHALTVIVPAPAATHAHATTSDGTDVPATIQAGNILVPISQPNTDISVEWR